MYSESNDDNQSITEINRNNSALFHNRFKLGNLHNVGRNTIKNYIVNKNTYTGGQKDFYTAGDRYNYTNFDKIDGNTVNINFAKDWSKMPNIQNRFNIFKMGQFRLFVNKNMEYRQVLNLINLINKYGPKRVIMQYLVIVLSLII